MMRFTSRIIAFGAILLLSCVSRYGVEAIRGIAASRRVPGELGSRAKAAVTTNTLILSPTDGTKGGHGRRLTAKELPTLNVDSITIKLDEILSFDSIMKNSESWYGTEKGGSGTLHLVRPFSSSHMEGLLTTSRGESWMVSTMAREGSLFVHKPGTVPSSGTEVSLHTHRETIYEERPKTLVSLRSFKNIESSLAKRQRRTTWKSIS